MAPNELRRIESLAGDLEQIVTPLTDVASGTDAAPVQALHVDDEPDFVEMAAIFLERNQERFTVVTATSAREGLDVIADGGIDCVISDYQMPGMDGLEFLRAVREDHPNLPFILCTGRGSEEIASEAISAGVTDYIQKGTDTDQYEVLVNRVGNAIDQYRAREKLWNTLSWYHVLVDQELAGVYLVQDERFVFVNREFADLFGYTPEELIGSSPLTVAAEADRNFVREHLIERADDAVEGHRCRFAGERKDGDHVAVEAHGGVVTYRDGPAILGVLLARTEQSNRANS